MIILVGVGHVFDIAEQVRQIILEHAPVAVGLELDGNRFGYIRARAMGQPVPEPKGMLAKFQARIAEDFGVQDVGHDEPEQRLPRGSRLSGHEMARSLLASHKPSGYE